MPRALKLCFAVWVFSLLSFALTTSAFGQTASLSTTSLNYGNQNLLVKSPPQTVTVTNTGSVNLTFTASQVSGPNAPDWAPLQVTCAGNLQPRKSCTIKAQFTPQATGARTATVLIYDNAPGSPQQVSLSGTGIAPIASFSSSSLNFGVVPVKGSAQMPVTLTNTGNVSLHVSNITTAGQYSQTNNCSTITPSSSCSITVTFSPSSNWSRMGILTVIDDGGTQTIPLSGMGSSGGVPTLSTTKLVFTKTQTVGTSSSQNVTLTNTGSGSIALHSMAASGDFTESSNCPATIHAGANCTLTITFTPTWPVYRPGEIVLSYTDPPMVQTLAVAGSGKVPATTVAVSPRQFSLTSSQTVQFAATISGSPTTNVNWLVDGIAGGNSAVGTIVNGLYTPPANPGSHSVTAVSIADSTQSASATAFVTAYSGTLTYHNDVARTGQNLTETVLSTQNVNSAQFGKLFSYALDGYVYAEPLYLPNVTLSNQTKHNVVYVATEHDSVFALDADSNQMLWQVSFINPAQGVATVPASDVSGNDLVPEIGITSTPVIDPANNTIYVMAATKELISGSYQYFQRLHALDITTGNERPSSPVTIQAVMAGTGAGHNKQNEIALDMLRQNQRPALLLLNGTIYIAWGSHNDGIPFHGWVVAYDEVSLQQTQVFISTPNGTEGGIWQGGAGPAADATGNVYVATSNGTFDAGSGGLDYGDSILRFNPSGGVGTVADHFTPFNQGYMFTHDIDLGSGGVLILPDQPGPHPHLLVGGGKGDTIYLVNRDNMGGYSPTVDSVVQELVNIFPANATGAGIRGVSAFFNGQIYTGAIADQIKAFVLYNGLLSTVPLSISAHSFYYPGVASAISANGSTQGILWALETGGYYNSTPAVLHAYDAANLGLELYNTTYIPARDTAGAAVKFTVPTVANGKVYVPAERELDVYGLLP